MILYNVTVKIEEEIAEQWLNYMLTKHIQDVIDTGCFMNARISKMIAHSEDAGPTYSIQYLAPSMKELHKYQAHFAPALQKEHVELFGEKALAYRSMMEVVSVFKT